MRMQDMCNQISLVIVEKHDVLHTRCIINMHVVQVRDASIMPSASALPLLPLQQTSPTVRSYKPVSTMW